MPGSAVKFTSACIWLFALLEYGWGQDVAHDSHVNSVRVPATGSTLLTMPGYIRHPRALTNETTSFCLTPPQPANGEYKLDRDFCDGIVNCEVAAGSRLELTSTLVYRCSPGFRLEGRSEVNCRVRGKWSPIPECVEVKCNSLNSVSTMVSCMYLEKEINCHSPVPRGTRAEVRCRRGYKRDLDSALSTRRRFVLCEVNGKWNPQPIRCIPACGRAINNQQPLVYGGKPARIGEFPWHASLFEQKNSPSGNMKVFLCGATVIHTNLLLTAAHCVYDESTRTTTDPGRLFVVTGNIFRDYDSPVHNSNLVRRAAVKNVYVSCDYDGLRAHYVSDIALLELQQPFELSDILLPACLYDSENGEQILDPGEYGRVAGFGRTEKGTTSAFLQTIRVPYISNNQCRASNSATEGLPFISNDKFCAGYSNGSAVCEGDSGGGLVFRKGELWYVMGIVSTGLGVDTRNGERKCDEFSYSLYTRVSSYIHWIQDVLRYVEQNKQYPSCNYDGETSTPTIIPNGAPTSMTSSLPHSCSAPPQPANGERKLHQKYCENDSGMDCDVPPGTEVKSGSQLVYRCASGFITNGTTDVYCLANGEWTPFPTCTEVRCPSLNSASTIVECTRFGQWVNCDAPALPATRAELNCRHGYKKDTVFVTPRRAVVNCLETGQWDPQPIRCMLVCGLTVTNQQPVVLGGTLAKVGEFPWHVSLFLQVDSPSGSEKVFLCGATIIHTNVVMTAAHCVYDESTKTTHDARKLHLITGNIFRDYDSDNHDPNIVRTATAKNVYTSCNYYGLSGKYVSDIGLIELEQPFEFSVILLPACLDVSDKSDQYLELGVYGKLAGFGKTDTGLSSAVLKTITVPYISYKQCKASKNYAQNQAFISGDKFCGGHNNGSAVCEGDSGGGLMIFKSNLWYVMGIASVGLGFNFDDGEFTCDKYSYSLYTKVSAHMPWIQDVLSAVDRKQRYPSCNRDPETSTPTIIPNGAPTSMTSSLAHSCSAPPQPANGERKLHQKYCENDSGTDCDVLPGTEVRSGSQLIYRCYSGFITKGSADVYCLANGEWTPSPTCTEVTCKSLTSTSTLVECSRFEQWVNCNAPVLPATRAKLTCRHGYRQDFVSTTPRRAVVNCLDTGHWDSQPIRCSLDCGLAVTNQRPLVSGGTLARVGEFPWHVSLFSQVDSPSRSEKVFLCGATIIHTNLVITAAHCVYDEKTQTTHDARKLHLITGNIFRDYDSDNHDPNIVRKATAKNVYTPCNYDGSRLNYYSDIGLIELQQPFEFSGLLRPACLDFSADSEQYLEPGVYGRVPGFGKTDSGSFSAVLRTITVPYVSYMQCKASMKEGRFQALITGDKFCAGYNNGSAVCEGDSGGGLVFMRAEQWFVRGIVSVRFGVDFDEKTCDENSYSLYTKVSKYMQWIRDVLSAVDRKQRYLSCNRDP